MSYGKLRANYAEVGNDAPIYSVNDVYNVLPPIGSVGQATVPSIKNNVDLKPERTKSAEVGLGNGLPEKPRRDLMLHITRQKPVDQIVPVTLSTSTGYTAYYLNSGTVQNRGIELSVYGTPFKNS